MQRYKAGILSQSEAEYVSARSLAKNPSGMGTWAKIGNALGLAAVSAVPYVGGAVSQFGTAYEQQRFADIQRGAQNTLAEIQAAKQAKAAAARPAPSLPQFWGSDSLIPQWGNIQGSGVYGGGVGTGGTATAPVLGEITTAFASVSPTGWAIIAGITLVILFLMRGR